jgi:hypothetical protein
VVDGIRQDLHGPILSAEMGQPERQHEKAFGVAHAPGARRQLNLPPDDD